MRSSGWLLAATAAGAVGMAACGNEVTVLSSATDGEYCTPGATRPCYGPGQCPGIQTCSSDGTAWSTCYCGSGASGNTGAYGATGNTGGWGATGNWGGYGAYGNAGGSGASSNLAGFGQGGAPVDGLVAYYPFNGDAKDESGHGNDGVVHGATLTDNWYGFPNRAYRFDGVGSYIEVGYSSDFDFSDEQGISFGYWLRAESLHYDFNVALGKDAPCGYFAYALDVVQDGSIEAAVHGSDCWITTYSPTHVATGEWMHLFVTVDESKMTLYLNGQEEIAVPTTSVEWNHPYQGSTYIGAWGGIVGGGLDGFFAGVIDEVRIYDRPLTPSEVAAVSHYP